MIKHISAVLFLLCLPLLSGQIKILVTIPPQLEAVTAVGGSLVSAVAVVPKGASPETFSPSPKQMIAFSDARLMLSIGAPMEKAFLERLQKTFPQIKVVNGREGMTEREMHEHHHHGEHQGHHENLDPHAWLSVSNMKIHTVNIEKALSTLLPEHSELFKKNCTEYLKKLDELEQELSAALSPYEGQSILVYHPAFGYFLDQFGIKQLAVEEDGKEPSARHIAQIVHEAGKINAHTLFTQPQSSRKNAAAAAKALKLDLAVLDPLPEQYSGGITELSNTVRKELEARK